MTGIGLSARAGIVACLLVALAGIGAARVPSADPGLCIPLLAQCTSPSPSPAPSPTPSPAPSDPLGGLLPTPGTGTTPGATPGPTVPPVAAVADPGAPTFTLPAAQLGGSSITFTGLQSVTVVTVPLADGTTTPVIKLVADTITIEDFMLDVRKATGPSLVTDATRMELRGHVQVYLDSLTATLADGTGLTVGAATPPPGNELPSQLLRVNLGLVGVTAASISFTAPHQSLKD
ncbi:MAG: hypothetical protein QOE21_1046 [Microbacteriaceae bacterium]|nr:hypothetical protein [Microbacteriaceae bacterium]